MNFKIKKAFTLVELMIVIGIIGLLLLAVAGLMNSQNTKQQRAIRFAELTEDIIISAKQDMIIGRGTWSGSSADKTMIPNSSRSVFLSGGAIISQYTPVKGTLTKKRAYEEPFLEGDRNYTIEAIQTSSGRIQSNDTLPNGNDWGYNLSKLTLTFGANGVMTLSNNDVSFMITLEYEGFRRYVVGDTVSGVITTYRQAVKVSP